jgi:toxin-antitoxin system PIN domain toxin
LNTSLKTSNVADVNLWVSLLVREHPHHGSTMEWFEPLAPGDMGLCRVAMLSVVRLLSTRAVMGPGVLTSAQAWLRMEETLDDERTAYLHEPPGIDVIMPTLFRYREPAPNLVNDAYLAAFATASGRTLVTYDQGYREFAGLEVQILG